MLGGGLTRARLYLLEGCPGTGKTTASLQFLLEGVRRGETSLYVTMSETEAELRETATSHGWTLDGIAIFELVPPESLLDANQQQSLLYSSDLELGETTRQVFDAIDRIKPSRVVLDSLSEIRLLAGSSLRYRRQVLAMKHYLTRTEATVLMLDDLSANTADNTVHSIAHGVMRLEELAPDYGAQRRRMRVVKYRGQSFLGGYHDQDCYFNQPTQYLPNLHDHRLLERMRQNTYVLATGVHDQCWDANEKLARILQHKAIPVRYDVWVGQTGHDWPWWRDMLQTYL